MVSSGGHGSKNWVRDLRPRASGQVRKDDQSWNQERRSHCGTALLHPTITYVIAGPLGATETVSQFRSWFDGLTTNGL
jgi:hypothetical protein